jgi:hypothetical protein
MKYALILATLVLAGCAGAPITNTTHSVCARLPMIRAAEDLALAMAEREPKPEELAALALSRAQMDARCAEAAK